MGVKDKMINSRTSVVPGPSRSNTLLRVPELELELCPPPSGSFLPPSTVTLRVSRVPDITSADNPQNKITFCPDRVAILLAFATSQTYETTLQKKRLSIKYMRLAQHVRSRNSIWLPDYENFLKILIRKLLSFYLISL